MYVDVSFRQRELHLVRVGKERQPRGLLLPRETARVLREIIAAQNDVLRRRGDWLAARRGEDVVRRKHEHARLHLRLDRQRHVDRHLVAVEIRVVSGANERMNSNRLALDELRLERLNRKPMQGRRAV